MINAEKLEGCRVELVYCFKLVNETILSQFDNAINVTSGKGFKKHAGNSYHGFGLAGDGTFKCKGFFGAYYIQMVTDNFEYNGFKVAELGIYRDYKDQDKWSFHIAISDTPGTVCKYFTGVYNEPKKV